MLNVLRIQTLEWMHFWPLHLSWPRVTESHRFQGLPKGYAFGLVAWTGNDALNRRLRLLAESKRFRLDDKGLFPATHGSGKQRQCKIEVCT